MDLGYISNPRVPIAWASVETLVERYFKNGPEGLTEFDVEIAITAPVIDSGSFGVKGTWRRTSPDELVMAVFHAIAARIDAKASHDELTLWLNALLTTPASFVKLETEAEISWRSSKLREDIESNNTLARTAVQKVFDIAQRRVELGNVSAEALYEVWCKKVGQAEGVASADQVTVSFIEKAFMIWDRALRKEAIQEIVLAEENMRQRSLFNSVVAMWALVSKAKTDDNIDWVFASINDGRRMGVVASDHMSVRGLQGTAANNGKGMVDLILTRKLMLEHLVNVYLPAKALSTHKRP